MPSQSNPFLIGRGRVVQALRRFFDGRGYVEVETPVRIPVPALELHVDAEPSGDCFLRTSPELHMKRLLTTGCRRLYQIGPCFRQRERGRLHNPEFTMLEWYRADADYMDILAETVDLLMAVCRDVKGGACFTYRGQALDVGAPWSEWAVRDIFRKAAGWDPVAAFDADRFDLDLVNKVEPALPADRPCVLRDYPAAVAALARRKPDNPAVAERWELYLAGMELANAFSELTDPAEQRARFLACVEERRRAGRPVYPLDEDFLAALGQGMPPCAGIALGVDRLVMILTDAESIEEVRMFCR